MTLRRRTAVLAVVAIAVVIVLGALVAQRFADVVSAGGQVYDRLGPAGDLADRMALYRVATEGDLQDIVLTGSEEHLATFREDLAQADAALAELQALLGGDPTFATALDRARATRGRWWTEDAGPTLALVRSGRQQQAAALTESEVAWAAYDAYVDSATAVQDLVDERRSAAYAELAAFTGQLRWVLVGTVSILIAGVLLVGLLLNRWVLVPLDSLRRQVRAVARRGEHEQPIAASGPPELRAVGTDTEALRRQLVAEIDQARAAREGLAQDAPVVAALRRELHTPSDPAAPGLRLHGEVQAAEGVLAGDWWDCVRLPDGGTAVVVTDVSGHGPVAGLTAMRVKGVIRPALEAGTAPVDAVAAAVGVFAEEEAAFATVVVVGVDPGSGAVAWANAGHHPPLLMRAGGDVERLDPTGPLLSVLGGGWTQRRAVLAPGDLLIAYSDGLVESRDGEGEELGADGLVALASTARSIPGGGDPDEVVERVVAAARERAVDWRRDDVTLVALSLAR